MQCLTYSEAFPQRQIAKRHKKDPHSVYYTVFPFAYY